MSAVRADGCPCSPHSRASRHRHRIVNHGIGNAGAFAVASLIETAQRLLLVDVSRNKMTPEGISRIAEAVSWSKSVNTLK